MVIALVGWLGCGSTESLTTPLPPSPPVDSSAGLSWMSTVPDIAERVVKSVVTVTVGRSERSPVWHPDRPTPWPKNGSEGLGSGVVVRSDGIVVTNHHVVEGAVQVEVTFDGGQSYPVRVLGSDPRTDIAVLQMERLPPHLVALEFGDSDSLRLGEVVLAVGNPYGVGQTVTMGIVSAKGRANLGLVDYEDFIQTDAAINPGNSGGALVDLDGTLVGINTALYSQSGGSNGIGFAIPAGLARDITARILEKGRVSRGYLGIEVRDLSAEQRSALGLGPDEGIEVGKVAPESPADRAGIATGDVLLTFDGRSLDAARFPIAVAAAGSAHTFHIAVLRAGSRVEIVGLLGDLPGDQIVGPGNELARELKLEFLNDAIRETEQFPLGLQGVWIRAVASKGRFSSGGVLPKDIVLEVNGSVVSTPEELTRRYSEGMRGRVWIKIWRDRQIVVLGV